MVKKTAAETTPQGKLTIFLGAASGVGKTYAMLTQAQQRLSEGIGIIAGWVDTHEQPALAVLQKSIPTVPLRLFTYRGKQFTEIDMETILTQNPDLVLIDELAHANTPGARHKRRFQDVQELLSAGIDVYTTLNVQHLESQNDIVLRITGVKVRDTVPDYILEQADVVHLVDLPSKELLQRFRQGKIYCPKHAEQAAKRFFRLGNLTALREMSLRITANCVNQDVDNYMRRHRIEGPWPAGARVLVAVSSSRFSSQLIRSAHQLAKGLQSEWLAVHVQMANPRFAVGGEEINRISDNMKLAEELGAIPLTIVGEDPATELLQLAKTRNVSAIVVGKPMHTRLYELLHGPIVEKLINNRYGINVYIVQGEEDSVAPPRLKTADIVRVSAAPYLYGLVLTALVSICALLLDRTLHETNIALLYLLPVLLIAHQWGRWPSYITAIASIVTYDFFFIPPYYTLTVSDMRYLGSVIIFLLVSFIIGGRTERLRKEAAFARQRERSTQTLYEISRQLANLHQMPDILRTLIRSALDSLDRPILLFLPDDNNTLAMQATSNAESGARLSAQEMSIAAWVYQHGRLAGAGTDTNPHAAYLYLPLSTRGNTLGVLGLAVKNRPLSLEERRLVEAWTNLAALAIERVQLSERVRQANILTESEKLRTALFNSVSHELRTPLASIIGCSSALAEERQLFSLDEQTSLLDNIRDSAARMDRIVANLLDSARLEQGRLHLKVDWCDLEDLVGAALQQLGPILGKRPVDINLPDKLPLIKGDFVLLEQVLANLIENAHKYSPLDAPITICAKVNEKKLLLSVADHGPGVNESEIPQLFEKFYRSASTSHVFGTGLGLSIVKGIAEAHGGSVIARNIPDGGALFSLALPIGAQPGKAGQENG